jgi:oligopeptidase B
VEFDEPAYALGLCDEQDPVTGRLRYTYSSMTSPRRVVELDVEGGSHKPVWEERVLGGFETANYASERIWAKAPDETQIPISLVYRKDRFRRDGTCPLLLKGYGYLGVNTEAEFNADDLCLLDRGFVVALAHVRGGQEMGRHWYEQGRLHNKKNSFTDFNACAERLLEAGYADPGRIFAMGNSGGGLLVGAAVNLRPELFTGVILGAPFLDLVTTMLDERIPLSTILASESGDPKNPDDYAYMLSYSPYDNIHKASYPHMLVTAGLNDSNVMYWEPAKWVARLRANKTDENVLLLRTLMSSGHYGPSGRSARQEEGALRYAFLLGLAGMD